MGEFVGGADHRAGELAVLGTDSSEQTGLATAGPGQPLVGDQFNVRIGDVGPLPTSCVEGLPRARTRMQHRKV